MKRRDRHDGERRTYYDEDTQRSRKRKAETDEENYKLVECGIKHAGISALSVPYEYFTSTHFGGSTPEKENGNQETPGKEVSHGAEDGDRKLRPSLTTVNFRDTGLGERDLCDIEDDLLYKKTLKKSRFWRFLCPYSMKDDDLSLTNKVSKEEPTSFLCRFFLSYAIARDIGMRSAIFLKIRGFIFYFIFLTLLTFVSFGAFSTEAYHFVEAVSSVFEECVCYCNGRATALDSMKNIEETLCFIEHCFKPGMNRVLWARIGDESEITLLTTPRFRQVRVTASPCLLTLTSDNECFSKYSEITESKQTYGSGTDGFVYWKSDDKPTYFRGYYNTYGNNGFTFLTSLHNDSYAYLPSRRWIDSATSAIFIDFALYSTNTNLFCTVQFLFESPPTGLVRPLLTVRAMFLMRYHSIYGHYLLFMEIMLMFMNLGRTLQILVEILYFKFRYIMLFSGWFDLATTSLCWYVGYCLVTRYLAMDHFLKYRLLREEFVDFQPIQQEQLHCTTMVAILFFFASFKLYDFLSFDLMEHLRITIRTSFKNIIVFACVFTVIVWGFVQVAILLFGHTLEKYRSFSSSFSELIKVMLGDLDYKGPMLYSGVIGPVFIIAYVIFAIFVLLSMFFAIINSTFTIVSSIVDIEIESYTGFLKHCARKMLFKCCKQREEVASKEQKKAKNSERIRNLLLDSGYTDIEIKLFFCRYIVDDDQELDDAVFEKMWNLRIQPERLNDLKGLVDELGTTVDALLHKSNWVAQRINQIQEQKLWRAKPAKPEMQ